MNGTCLGPLHTSLDSHPGAFALRCSSFGFGLKAVQDLWCEPNKQTLVVEDHYRCELSLWYIVLMQKVFHGRHQILYYSVPVVQSYVQIGHVLTSADDR